MSKAVRKHAVHFSANDGGRFILPWKAENPHKICYDPELDTSLELDLDVAFYYLTVTGILRLVIKLRRINIITKVLLLSSHVPLPRKRYLDLAMHVMAHVDQRYNSRLVYYPSYMEIGHGVFKKCDCSEFYRDSKEAIPMNAPELQGQELFLMFVDSDRKGEKVSCRSRSNFLIYVNTTLVQ